jgi:L-2-hydroxyglutarate oxidase LhgO
MHAYCASKGIPVLPVGKLVVAVEEAELPRLHELYDQALRNGVPGVVPAPSSPLVHPNDLVVGSAAWVASD